MNRISRSKLQLLLFALIISSCVYEDEMHDPSPESLFRAYTSTIGVDEIINPSSNYISVIGDIQEYISPYDLGTDSYHYFLNTMAWIYVQNKVYNNIKCVLQDGDITWGNMYSQWCRYQVGASFIEETLPFLICTGNHDYDWSISNDGRWIIEDRRSSMFNSFFPGKAVESHITDRFEDDVLDNYIAKFVIGENTINILVLEFAPRTEAVDWACNIVSTHSNERYILMTHEMLDKNGFVYRNSSSEYHFKGISSTYSTPKDIWDKLVYPNNNVICTLCGHNDYFNHVKLENAYGRKVSNILFNLQYQPNGGDGKIMLWEFPLNKDVMKVSIYNTVTRSIESEKMEEFEIDLNYL